MRTNRRNTPSKSNSGHKLDTLYNKAQPAEQTLMRMIAQRAISRTRKDIATWRSAIQSAESPDRPNRTTLYDVFADLELDMHLSSQMGLRKAKTIHNPFVIVDSAGNTDEDLRELFEKEWFYDLMGNILDARFWGHSLIELEFGDNLNQNDAIKLNRVALKAHLVPRYNVKQEAGLVVKNPSDEQGVPYREGGFNAIEVGKPKDLGLLVKAAPACIYKKNAYAAWADFSEIFGMPMRVGKTASRDPKVRGEMTKILKDMATAAYALLDDQDTIEFIENTKGDAFNVYDKLMERSNSELSKLIIGGTMLSDNGSSRSQSETHWKVSEEITKEDQLLVKFVLNDQLLPVLINNGYPLQGCKMRWDITDTPDKDQWEITKGVIESGYEVPEEYITEKFGIPITGLRQPKESDPPVNASGIHLQSPVSWLRWLLGGAALPGKIKGQVDQLYLPCGCSYTPPKAAKAELSEEEKELLAEFYKTGKDGKQRFNHKLFQKSYEKLISANQEAWAGQLDAVEYDSPDWVTSMLFDANLAIFGYDKTFCQVAELNRLMKSTKTFAEFKPLAESYLKKTHITYLETEYNYALAKAQSGAMWVKMIQEQEQFPVAIWRTMLDGAVRNSHKDLEGREFLLSEREQWKNLATPLGPGCRCYMEQGFALNPDKKANADTITRAIGDEAFGKLKKGGWLYNGGDLGEIFSHNRMYSEQLGIKPRDLFKITHNESGLKDYSELDNSSFPDWNISLDTSAEQAASLFESRAILQNGKRQVLYNDYRGRPCWLSEKTFKKHNTSKYEKLKRPAFFTLIEETLQKPDEVFLFEHVSGKYQIRYVKFYKDRVMTVPITLSTEGMNIQTWFEATEKDLGMERYNIDNSVRNGLPIKKQE
jgi:phage gp29-like protein